MTEPGGALPRIDTSKPHTARMYDYYLGGKDHFEIDRQTAEFTMQSWGSIRVGVRENRAFLGRVVRYLVAEAGIRQFLDIGTGLPSAGNVHEVAQGAAPECRVVYVDNDPIVLSHARALLTSSPEGRTASIDADPREPELRPGRGRAGRDPGHADRHPAVRQLPGRLPRHHRIQPGGDDGRGPDLHRLGRPEPAPVAG